MGRCENLFLRVMPIGTENGCAADDDHVCAEKSKPDNYENAQGPISEETSDDGGGDRQQPAGGAELF